MENNEMEHREQSNLENLEIALLTIVFNRILGT
jgi:hypothetical protein